jgi:hypothetical protein
MSTLKRFGHAIRRKWHEWAEYNRNQQAIAEATRVLGAYDASQTRLVWGVHGISVVLSGILCVDLIFRFVLWLAR